MVESFSFEEGEILGGPVLFQESEKSLGSRKKMMKRYLLMLPILLILVLIGPVYLFTGSSPIYFVLSILVVAGIVIALNRIGILLERPIENVTPISVYENGFAIGDGRRPFYRFSDVYHVEEYLDKNTKSSPGTLVTGITFVDGDFKTVYRQFISIELQCEFQCALTKRFAEVKKGLPWTKDAEDLLSSLTSVKGPTRLSIESWVRYHGETEVRLDFIRANWLEIVDGGGAFPHEFKVLANKLWGKPS